MEWILAAAVVAAFVLGLLFFDAYRKQGHHRIRGSSGRASSSQPSTGQAATGQAATGQADETGATGTVGPDGMADVDGYAASARRMADAEAASVLALARREAESVRRSAEDEADSLLEAAQSRAANARAAVQDETEQHRRGLQREADRAAEQDRITSAQLDTERSELHKQRHALDDRSTDLERTTADLAREREHAEAREHELTELEHELDRRADELGAREEEHQGELERISGLGADEAREELLRLVEARTRRDAAQLARDIEAEARSEATQRARHIVSEAVQRVASEQTTETVVSVMHLPAEEMKGRIIGREGRNIRAFESVTGVNVIIDDTPEAVLLSCFDPVRREVGRLTLEKLVLDGRIHPHRIEEAYELSRGEVDALCLRAAHDAVAEVGIANLDEHLLPTLGRLRYRTSYGQNVLGHLIETAHIGGIMAAELGVDPVLVKRCAFLHDIGKALTHEVEGSHAIVGAELLRRYGESDAVAHAVEAHHNEVAPRTIEAVLTQAADACSAARPGARRETLEAYVTRLHRIEEIASARPGVEKVFAMQAGREVRVMVVPDEVDDLEAQVIAREVAKQIEDELTYPGQIRVTVVRETRAVETAH